MKQKSVISSKNNPQVKNINLLQKKAKAREEQGVYVVEGTKMFEEARDLKLLQKAFLSESFYQMKLKETKNYFENLDYEVVSDSVFKEMSETKSPQGILGIVKQTSYSLEEITSNPTPLLLLLEDIRDPGNLGTMIRTAEGAGVSGIILNHSCVDIYNPKVVRSTMGSIYRMPYYQTKDFISTLTALKELGITIFAAHLNGRNYDLDGSFQQSCAFLIGNEANGLSEEASKMADIRIKIPMEGKVESLNAAIAAAILMYEAARQRRKVSNRKE